MIRTLLAAGAAACAIWGVSAAQRDFSDVEIKTTKVADGVYMLEGAGGNIGLSTGDDGAFVIDDQFAPLSDKIMAAIAAVTDDQVAFLINTHWHFDHTGGNEAFGKSGAHIVAHDNVRNRLKEGMLGGGGLPDVGPASAEALPVITFSKTISFHWNGEHIKAWHPDPAHTDGDAVIFFKEANVVHMGDIFFNGTYPFIDLRSGGDVDGYIETQEAILARIDDNTKIIPGHGPLASKADLQRTTDMLKDVRARVQALVDEGVDADAAVAADPLADLNEDWGQGFINGERMVRTVHEALIAK